MLRIWQSSLHVPLPTATLVTNPGSPSLLLHWGGNISHLSSADRVAGSRARTPLTPSVNQTAPCILWTGATRRQTCSHSLCSEYQRDPGARLATSHPAQTRSVSDAGPPRGVQIKSSRKRAECWPAAPLGWGGTYPSTAAPGCYPAPNLGGTELFISIKLIYVETVSTLAVLQSMGSPRVTDNLVTQQQRSL